MHLVYPQYLLNHCFQFLLGITVVPREIEGNGNAKFWGVSKVRYGLRENDELKRGFRRDWQNVFAITRFRYIEVLSIYFTITGVKKWFVLPRTSLYRGLLYRGLRYIEVRYIEDFVI